MCSYGHRFALMIAMSLYCESCLQLQNTLCFVRQSLDKTLSEPLQVLHENPSIAFKWLSGKFSARETIFLGVLVGVRKQQQLHVLYYLYSIFIFCSCRNVHILDSYETNNLVFPSES